MWDVVLIRPGYSVSVRFPLILFCAVMGLAGLIGFPASAAEKYFEVRSFENKGRSVAGQLADLNGDGRTDFFIVNLTGIPPEDQRTARVFLQDEKGGFSATPNFERVLPVWSAVYDVDDIRPETPGAELLILLPDGIEVISLAAPDAPHWNFKTPGPTTMGPAADERGLEVFQMVHRHIGEEPWMLIPQIGQLTALDGEGGIHAAIAQPRRANFFILPPTTLVSLESNFQIFVDAPKLLLGDINGDGRNDIASATRHEIWVSYQTEEGTFRFEPDEKLPLRMMKPRDQVRGSGGVASSVGDIDGDGLLDLVVSHVQGGFSDATTRVHVYLNRDGQWKIEEPNQTMVEEGSISSNALVDMDRDGRMELVQLQFNFSLFEVIEILISREIDLEFSVYRYDGENGFAEKPWVRRQISLPISFKTFRTRGFIPTARFDVNGDGYQDFVSSGDGDRLAVNQGSSKGPFKMKEASQKLPTAGMIDFEDWNGDRLPDFLIMDPYNFDVPVQLGRNLGRLPGTPASLRGDP